MMEQGESHFVLLFDVLISGQSTSDRESENNTFDTKYL